MRVSALFTAIPLITQMSPASGTALERVGLLSQRDIHQSWRFIADRMAYYHDRGLSLTRTHDGIVEWTRAFGVAGVGGEPVTPVILFQASFNKSLGIGVLD